MVSIGIQRNSDGQVTGCHMSGHAGYDEHGFDIVCAALSALSATAMLGLTVLPSKKGGSIPIAKVDVIWFSPVRLTGVDRIFWRL
nr:ribosomal-processing cysteine protease Prp [Veillonella denticariosi]